MSDEISLHYKNFSELEGSQYIASEFAIRKIISIIRYYRIKNLLEVGLGIGSISGIVLNQIKDIDFLYQGTEANEFCLENLPKNLGVNYSRIEVSKDIKQIRKNRKFDLIIIDGKDSDLSLLQEHINPRAIIVIEGDRVPQQNLLQKLFPKHKYVHSISVLKNKEYSPFDPNSWQGGLKIIFINPTGFQSAWWLVEKVKSKMKYLYRREM